MEELAEDGTEFSSLWSYGNLMSLHLALRVAIESNIFNIIETAGPSAKLSTLEIASQIPTQNPNSIAVLDQLLRFLTVKSMLASSLRPDDPTNPNHQTRTYGLTNATRHMVTNKTENSTRASIAPLVIFGSEGIIFERINMLKGAILDPENSAFFSTSQRADLFELSSRNPSLNKSFNELMAFWSRRVMQSVLESYKGFEGVNEIMDVGGGIGISLQLITSAYPNVRGINFDLPHVVADAPSYKGVEHVAGDMFLSLPKAETIWMKAILHDWDDEKCQKILKNCWEALPEKGKVMALEIITPEDSGDDDLSEAAVESEFYVMLLNLHGKERTARHYHELARAAGFTETELFHVWDRMYVMEFLKNTT